MKDYALRVYKAVKAIRSFNPNNHKKPILKYSEFKEICARHNVSESKLKSITNFLIIDNLK